MDYDEMNNAMRRASQFGNEHPAPQKNTKWEWIMEPPKEYKAYTPPIPDYIVVVGMNGEKFVARSTNARLNDYQIIVQADNHYEASTIRRLLQEDAEK